MKLLFKKEFQIILGLIIFAVALRIPTLGSPLIEDEAISFNRYIDVPWQKLIFFYQDTNQHTLFLLISKFFIWVFGETEIIYRLPSVLFGAVSIPLMYRPWTGNEVLQICRSTFRIINDLVLATPKVFDGS